MIKTALLLGALSSATAEWEMTHVKGVTTLLGVDSPPGEGETFYAAAGETGKGSGYLKSTNGGQTSTFDYPQGGAMDMDIAVGEDGSTLAMVGTGIYVKDADSDKFARIPGMTGISQSVVAFQNGFGAAGQFQDSDGQFNGVAVSPDNGASWSLVDIGTNTTMGYYARYAAFPSADTWYVSTGTWPSDDEKASVRQLNKHVSKTGDFRARVPSVKGYDSYIGNIVKTTDGGATFSEVLNTKGQYYFNAVHCADDNNCIAVAEGGSGAVGYHTTDGGANWDMIVTEEDTGTGASMMAAYMTSANDFWFGGGSPNRDGMFFHSIDGSTITKETLSGGYTLGLTFRGGEGYAAVMGRSTCGVARYEV